MILVVVGEDGDDSIDNLLLVDLPCEDGGRGVLSEGLSDTFFFLNEIGLQLIDVHRYRLIIPFLFASHSIIDGDILHFPDSHLDT